MTAARRALVLAALVLGCQRKAPGPEECVAFAQRVAGVRDERDLARKSEQVDEITEECLLTPYDRELLACVDAGGRVQACMRAFSLRHAGVAPGNLPAHRRTRRREEP